MAHADNIHTCLSTQSCPATSASATVMRQSCASAAHRQPSCSASPSSSQHQSSLNGKLIMACIIFACWNEQGVCSHTQMTLLSGNCVDVCRGPLGRGGVSKGVSGGLCVHILIALRAQQINVYVLLLCGFKTVEGLVAGSTLTLCEPEQRGNRDSCRQSHSVLVPITKKQPRDETL